jgi:hypothetical protein
MPTPAYPLDLRTVLQSSKSRSQPAAFRMAEPRRGMPYVRAIGTIAPTQWNVQFHFTPAEAVRFQLWLAVTLQFGLLEFTMPIRTEAGLVSHLCQFLPDGLLDCKEEGESFIYEAQLIGVPA